MKHLLADLKQLQSQLMQITQDVETGKLSHVDAADAIVEIREKMDSLIETVRKQNEKKSN